MSTRTVFCLCAWAKFGQINVTSAQAFARVTVPSTSRRKALIDDFHDGRGLPSWTCTNYVSAFINRKLYLLIRWCIIIDYLLLLPNYLDGAEHEIRIGEIA